MTNKQHLPCDDCGSSDALTDYGDHTYCFSCKSRTYKIVLDRDKNSWFNKITTPPGDVIDSDVLNDSWLGRDSSVYPRTYSPVSYEGEMTKQYVGYRGIDASTMQFYDIICHVGEDGTPIKWEYPHGPKVSKFRMHGTKEFRYVGEDTSDKSIPLFGMDKFAPGCAKYITVTEGNEDAASAYQMLGKYPVVSVRSAADALSGCTRAREFLDSFEKIYLCFDADGPGRDAMKEVAALFRPGKVFIVNLQGKELKDANDYLVQGKDQEFRTLWWNAKSYKPDGIISDLSEIRDLLTSTRTTSIAHFPFPTLDEMSYGIRSAEVYLITAMEKVGKTEIVRAIEHHLLKTTDYNMGIIHLEEGVKKAVQGIVSYEIEAPVHLPDTGISEEAQADIFDRVAGRDGRVQFFSHFGSEDPDVILDTIRYMVAGCGCKFIFLDHITMLVTGFENDDTTKRLDYLSTRLAMLTRELDFALFLVSHVNDDGKTRGSRNISKVADLLIHLDRDVESSDLDKRNTTNIMVKGNRYGSKTGPGGYLWFDPVTHILKEKTIEQQANSSPF